MLNRGVLTFDAAGRVNTFAYSSSVGPNMVVFPQNFENAAWNKTDLTIVADAIAAPDGSMTADRFVEGVTSAGHYAGQGFTATSPTTYTLSAYFKKFSGGAVRYGQLVFAGTPFGATRSVVVDLDTGATAFSAGATGGAVYAGDGWWRVSITATTSAAGAASFQVKQSPNFSAAVGAYLGDGVSGEYAWGVMLNTGSTPGIYSPAFGIQFNGGTPTSGGALAMDGSATFGPGTSYNGGFLYAPNMALAVASEAPVTGYYAGLALNGDRLNITFANPIDHYVSGLPVDSVGRLCCAGTTPPTTNLSFSDGFSEGFA